MRREKKETRMKSFVKLCHGNSNDTHTLHTLIYTCMSTQKHVQSRAINVLEHHHNHKLITESLSQQRCCFVADRLLETQPGRGVFIQ